MSLPQVDFTAAVHQSGVDWLDKRCYAHPEGCWPGHAKRFWHPSHSRRQSVGFSRGLNNIRKWAEDDRMVPVPSDPPGRSRRLSEQCDKKEEAADRATARLPRLSSRASFSSGRRRHPDRWQTAAPAGDTCCPSHLRHNTPVASSAAPPPRQPIVLSAPRWLAPALLLPQVRTALPTVASGDLDRDRVPRLRSAPNLRLLSCRTLSYLRSSANETGSSSGSISSSCAEGSRRGRGPR